MRLVGVREDSWTGTTDSHCEPTVQQGGETCLFLPLSLFLLLPLTKSKRPESPGDAVFKNQTPETQNKMDKAGERTGKVDREYLAHTGRDNIF